MLPRHAAGSMELKEGTGSITAMVPCGDFMEIFKVDKTFRVQTPERVDPDGKNPNAPWVATPVDDVGSGNLIVARAFIQSYEMIKSGFLRKKVDVERITLKLRECKEALIACEKEAVNIIQDIDSIVSKVEKEGISTDNNGRGLNPFPHISNLDIRCGSFLVYTNRAIKSICEFPRFFIDLERSDSNFDHLEKRLSKILGEESSLVIFIRDNAEGIRYLVELRNFHEHPKEERTIIENFKLLPDMNIQVPMWGLSSNELHPIKEEMLATIGFLTDMAEAMIIHLIMSSPSDYPLALEIIEEEKIDPDKPIRYRLTVDISRMGIDLKDT